MHYPGIELAWGGEWKRSERRVVRPVMIDAIGLAGLALEEVGIKPESPKLVETWRGARNPDYLGVSLDSHKVEVLVRHDHIKHRVVGQHVCQYAGTVGHEITHSVRSELYPDNTIEEHIASEGLAYSAQAMLEDIIGPQPEVSVVDAAWGEGPTEAYQALKRQLYPYIGHQITQDAEPDPVFDIWLTSPIQQIPPGIRIGVVEVQKRLAEGVAIGELMEWPAGQILDLQSA